MTSRRRSGRRWSSDMPRTLTLIRNATVLLELDGQRLLVDPMLDEAGARPAVENTDNDRRNPLVELPLPLEEIRPRTRRHPRHPPPPRSLRRWGSPPLA